MSQQQEQGFTPPVDAVSGDDTLAYHAALADEVTANTGATKAHWQYLLNSIETMGRQKLRDRHAMALRILRDDGATYNIYSNNSNSNQTWQLDLVPYVINSDEWLNIEAGIAERAELFDALLKDIYGKRELISNNVIPPEALYVHRGFLRACHDIACPGEHQLIHFAVDLMRNSDGDMCVLSDRTQAPSGAGYALENRTVMSRVFPTLFRDSHVHRLAVFFQRYRATLAALAPTNEDPRIVLLSPGVHNETSFEHSYVANYLGFHLVQSGDLAVRNRKVYMKSLDGLSQVDVIVRRVDDWFCDPVELRGDSHLGVAGLLEAAREGNVVIANPLGSGVLENPIFTKYLGDIAKALLGRELRIPSVTTYWYADPNDQIYIRANFPQLIIKKIERKTVSRSIDAAALTPQAQAQLLQEMELRPMEFVAQERLSPFMVPAFDKHQLEPRPAILRTFAVASGSSYSVMPGGLTRVGQDSGSFNISNQAGSLSKDTWILASEPLTPSPASSDAEVPQHHDADLISLPSRVIENLFWMGRYAERAESSLRILRTVFMFLNAEEPLSEICKPYLLAAVTRVTGTAPGFIDASPELVAAPEAELIDVVANPLRHGSIRANLEAMLSCADQSKELLSSDTMRIINDIRDHLTTLSDDLGTDLSAAPEEALDPLVTALVALAGLIQESMIRGHGWRFIELGRRLERALQTSSLINQLVVPEVPEAEQKTLIEAMLISTEGLISHRRRYRAKIGVQSSLDLVMMDQDNPRSLIYQISALKQVVRELPTYKEKRHELNGEQRTVLEAETLIRLSILTELSARTDGRRQTLEQTLDKVTELLWAMNTFVSDKYFSHRESSQQLVSNAGL